VILPHLAPPILGSSKALSTYDLGLAIPNVKDGVCCLSSGNCVPRESETSPNVDINVFTKTLIQEIKKNKKNKIKNIYIYKISFNKLQHCFFFNL
jgi:hypothetical protein